MKGPGRKNHGTKKVLGLVMVVGVMAASTYAFTAANSVPATEAGDGAGAITGYQVSAIEYLPDATDPSKVDGVRFILDAAAETVRAQIDRDASVTGSADSAWSSCTSVGGTNVLDLLGNTIVAPANTWQCTYNDYPAQHAGSLQVVAYSSTP
ncbi:MAG: hypothetical protein ACLGIB_09185 [Actinomycetota bacterium]